MTKHTFTLALIGALVLAGAVPLVVQAAAPLGPTVPQPSKELEAKLIAVIRSDAPVKEKSEACRQLGAIGTRDAVPALAALLGDEKLSHMARYGLEPIQDPAVDEALRDASGKLKGRPLVGVIGSLGVRHDAKAIPALAGLLGDSDPDVAQAAARALGKIGTAEAAQAIQGALAGVSAANQLAFCEGLFRCAEAMAARGERDQALAAYERLRSLTPAPHQVRSGALRGAILIRGKDGIELLRQSLASKDYILFAAAIRVAQDLPGEEVTQALSAALPGLPADNQIVVIQALGRRADPAGLPALLAAAKAGPKPVRLAAIRAVAQIGSARAAAGLIELMGDAERDVAQAAQETLAALPGQEVDAAVKAMFGSDDNTRRMTALELIGQRRMISAIPALLKATGDADANVRSTALKRLGELCTAEQLPALLDLLMQAKSPEDVSAAEQALGMVCAKVDNPDACAEKLARLVSQADAAKKAALLRVLGKLGGPAALKAVRAAANDPNAEIRAAAIRSLGAWKSAEVVPDLLALARSAANATDKMLGLRGYLGWAANAEVPADQRLAMCRQAGELAQKPAEKRLLLSALGHLASPESLALIVPHLEDASTKNEAASAAVGIAEKLLKGRESNRTAPKLIEPLEKVTQSGANADLTERAKAALDLAKRRARRK